MPGPPRHDNPAEGPSERAASSAGAALEYLRRSAIPRKLLQPKDFPVHDEGKTIVTDGSKVIAKANDPKSAEEICDRLNTDEARREDDRWT